MKVINFNTQLISEDVAVFTNKNRAFRYGDGIFESVKIINGNPCFLKFHIQRLKESMTILKMKVPDFFSEIFFSEELKKLLNENKISEGGRARITIFRNDGGLYTPYECSVSYIIEAEPMDENKFVLNPKGLKIDLYEEIKKPINKLSNIKSNNALIFVLASIFKMEKELDDCIILNENGHLTEATSSNLFIMKKKEIFTPPLNEGCIAGVMRNVVILLANENGFEVKECSLNSEDLFSADEVFLTNAIAGIRWVGAFQRRRYYNSVASFLTDKLNLFF